MRLCHLFLSAGLLAIGGSTWMSTVAAGGIEAPAVPGIFASALIAAVGAAAVSSAYDHKAWVLAGILTLGLFTGEGVTVLLTARRVADARDATSAPLRKDAEKRSAAEAELEAAKIKQPETPARARIEAAEKALAEARANVSRDAAKKGCADNCADLLREAVNTAQAEVAAARKDYEDKAVQAQKRIQDRIVLAETALAALPPPRSTSALADAVGVREDLLVAAEAIGLSLALNLPASALVALSIRMWPRRRDEDEVEPGQLVAAEVRSAPEPEALFPEVMSEAAAAPQALAQISAPKRRRRATATETVAAFGLDCLLPDAQCVAPLSDLLDCFHDWCAGQGVRALKVETFARELQSLLTDVGVKIDAQGAHGIKLKRATHMHIAAE